ncbi:MAG: NAD(P)-binding domain-containing protein [Desulfoferrobacter sp.]
MELGIIGLGRMGANIVRRLLKAGHQCVVYDIHPEAVQALAKEKAVEATSIEDFVHKLSKPRALRYQFGGHEEKDTPPKGGV